MADEDAMAAAAAIAARVSAFYEQHPYPPPRDDLGAYRRRWDDARRRAESHLLWPAEPYRADRSILVAGCGTTQAAHYAVRWPAARVVGIDVSASSVAFTQELKRKHELVNLEVRELSVERAGELGETFDYIACTGVLHHLPDPDAGIRALRDVLRPDGAMHVMLYAPYGRAGVYMLQDYCRRLGIEAGAEAIRDLAATLQALPAAHPLAPLLRNAPDFASEAGLADALLNPNDRAYSVPQLMEFLQGAGMTFGRWLRQAPYLAACGAPALTPHARRLTELPDAAQYAAMELLRGTMVRHSAIVYRSDSYRHAVDFEGDRWQRYVPIRLPNTVVVRDRLPTGAAVLINRDHSDNDLYLPIDALQERILEGIDGRRQIAQMGRAMADRDAARTFFRRLWQWDQVIFDTSAA
jgi:SAM-dependent methyltransferase